MRFQFNPPDFTENFNANYARHNVPGLSYQVMHYINTNNETIPLQIYMSELLLAEMQMIPTAGANWGGIPIAQAGMPHNVIGFVGPEQKAPSLSIMDQKRFLQSLVFPQSSPSGGSLSPPAILFAWPKVIRMTARVTQLSFRHQRFSIDTLETTILVANLTLEECSGVQRFSQQIRTGGSLQSQGAGAFGPFGVSF